MGTQQELTTEQVSIILWVKALNDFTNPEYPEDTLDEKIEKFDLISADITSETFIAGMEKMKELGIIEMQGADNEYVLTAKGKGVMKALDSVSGFSDETVQKIMNRTIKTIEFAKEHLMDIINIVAGIVF